MKYFSTPNGNIYRIIILSAITLMQIAFVFLPTPMHSVEHSSETDLFFASGWMIIPVEGVFIYFLFFRFYDVKFNETHIEAKRIFGSRLIPLDIITDVDIGYMDLRMLDKFANVITFTTSSGVKIRCISREFKHGEKVTELPEYKELMKYIEEQSREY